MQPRIVILLSAWLLGWLAFALVGNSWHTGRLLVPVFVASQAISILAFSRVTAAIGADITGYA